MFKTEDRISVRSVFVQCSFGVRSVFVRSDESKELNHFSLSCKQTFVFQIRNWTTLCWNDSQNSQQWFHTHTHTLEQWDHQLIWVQLWCHSCQVISCRPREPYKHLAVSLNTHTHTLSIADTQWDSTIVQTLHLVHLECFLKTSCSIFLILSISVFQTVLLVFFVV